MKKPVPLWSVLLSAVVLLGVVAYAWPLQPITGGDDCRKIVGHLIVCKEVRTEPMAAPPAQQPASKSEAAPPAKK